MSDLRAALGRGLFDLFFAFHGLLDERVGEDELGFKHLGCRTRLLGISAQQPAPRLKAWICGTADEASTLLGMAMRGGPERRITVDEIQKTVADHFNMKQADLLSERRTRSVARPRHISARA